MKPIIVAHRGVSLFSREKEQSQSLQNIDYVEIDLDISRDGIVFVFHDPHVGLFIFREPYLCVEKGVKKKAHELLFSEIQKLFPSAISFEEFLKTVDVSHLLCELKSYTPYKGIIHVLHRMYPEAFHKLRFISFSLHALKEVKAIDPSIYCSYIATSGGDDKRFNFAVHRKHIKECVQNGIEEISGLWLTFRPRMIQKAHAQGLCVGLGQINTPYRVSYCKKNTIEVWYTDNVDYVQRRIK